MLLVPYTISIPTTVATAPLGDGWRESSTAVYKTGHPIYLITKNLCWNHSLVSIYIGHKYLNVFSRSQRAIFMLLPQISLTPIFQSCSFQVPEHPPKLLTVPQKTYTCGAAVVVQQVKLQHRTHTSPNRVHGSSPNYPASPLTSCLVLLKRQ